MSTPEPPSNAGPAATPAATPAAATGASAPAGGAAAEGAAAAGPTAAPPKSTSTVGHAPKPPPEPLHGWRGALEHTGMPRSVLTWKPRMPSRNWTIFLTVVGTLSYLYVDDRRQCKRIRQEYIDKVAYLAQQQMDGSLDVPRTVKVYGARWPEDDDSDRALRYFRKYVKPYLVAAAIDYEQVHAPLHGSVARIVRADTLRKRRESVGLEQPEPRPDLPGQLDPAAAAQRELEGGTILVGRHTLKEYLAGLQAGWSNGVRSWSWEKDIENAIKNDGVFDEPVVVAEVPAVDTAAVIVDETPAPAPAAPTSSGWGSLFGRKSAPAPAVVPIAQQDQQDATENIPERLNTPPSPLPAQPPILLVPFINHLGFLQIPYMLYDFFTERKRVQAGADAAYALIMNQTRPMTGPGDETSPSAQLDTDFDTNAERYYKSKFFKLGERNEKTRKEYYHDLQPKLEAARAFARGERELTDEEKKSPKPIVTEEALREERKKKELRWRGGEEGAGIIDPKTPVAWMQPQWHGWLAVYEQPSEVPEIDD